MAKDRLIFANTKYSCLATFDPVHSFQAAWKPRFTSKLAPEDRCHLNGLAIKDGAPKYMTESADVRRPRHPEMRTVITFAETSDSTAEAVA
jgi:uncharacterized protein (TIGR03032 family)